MTNAVPDPMLPLEEALRTIGAALDAPRIQQAQVTVGPDGIEVHADWMYGYRRYLWADVAGLSRGHAAQRRARPVPRPWLDSLSLTRWTVLLRVAGRLLDAQGIRACAIDAAVGRTPETSTLRAWTGGQQVMDQTALSEEIVRLRREVFTSQSVATGAGAPANAVALIRRATS